MEYEICFWLKDAGTDTLPVQDLEKIRNAVEKSGGSITSEKALEKRFFAYPLKKQKTGFWGEIQFSGEKGETVNLENGEVKLTASTFNNNQARFYNMELPLGKTIYFFVVKDKNGIYRAAANACAVCFKTYKGFRQEGDEIVCNNCGNRYPIEKIATEKGGCNPGPINPNLEVKKGQIIIKQADLEQILNLF